MRYSVYEQFAIVKEDSAALLTEKLNEQIYELRRFRPVVTFSDADPLCAYIKYMERVSIPETLADEYELQGISFTCAQCPYFRATAKGNGEADKRCKWGDCNFAEYGRTYKTTPACDKLYELIREGDVKVCFTD